MLNDKIKVHKSRAKLSKIILTKNVLKFIFNFFKINQLFIIELFISFFSALIPLKLALFMHFMSNHI